ncbi:MAG: DUF308 domain-containing protein [Lactobacillaceae bacterium]|jgi:uncharacterized membrane protein HdeD (DUF308 family)|nr:DUF308 domain-containing protein [Lactobacillaceae bacterium]
MKNMKKIEKELEKIEPNAGGLFLAIGIIMVCLGVYVWFHPVDTLIALALYLGVVFVAAGALYLYIAFQHNSSWHLALGLLDLLVGVIFLSNLGVTAASLPIVFALWTLFVGVIQVGEAFYRKSVSYPWGWELAFGILGILFAFLIMAYPGIGAFTITMLMGSYIILYGLLGFIEYAALKKMRRK